MPRTTLDLDASVLRAVKRIAQRTGKSIGDVVSELLVSAIGKEQTPRKRLHWTSKPMHARVDLGDKDTVYRILDEG